MKSAKELFAFMDTPEFPAAVQQAIEADRQTKISFRRELVDAFNQHQQAAGARPDPDTLETQKRFTSLTMPTEEAHAMAARYATQVGRQLPSPPPSLTLDDV